MSGANFKLPEINMSSNVTPHTKLYSVLCCTIKLKFSSHPRQQCVLKWLYFTRGKMLSIMKILFLLKHRDFTKCPNNWSETKIFCLFQAKNWWEKWWSQSWKSFPFSTFWLGVSFVYLQEFDWQISRFLSLRKIRLLFRSRVKFEKISSYCKKVIKVLRIITKWQKYSWSCW